MVQTSGSSQSFESVHCPATHSCLNVPLPLKPHVVLPSVKLPSVQTSRSVHTSGLFCHVPFTHLCANSPRLFRPQAVPPLGRVSLLVQTSGSSQSSESVHCPATHSCINVPLPLKPHASPPVKIPSVQTSRSVHTAGAGRKGAVEGKKKRPRLARKETLIVVGAYVENISPQGESAVYVCAYASSVKRVTLGRWTSLA